MECRAPTEYENERIKEILNDIFKLLNEKLTKEEMEDFNLPANMLITALINLSFPFIRTIESKKKFAFQVAAGMIKIFEAKEKNGN